MGHKAFVSYSHAADGQLAPALHSALHRFAKPWYRLRAIDVFRDKTNLSVDPGLWPSIEKALGGSEFFVLLASPEAATSVWVAREVSYWLETAPLDRLLIVLTDGDLVWDAATNAIDREATNSLPPVLADKLIEEPLFLDLRWARTSDDLSLANPRFRESVAELSATLRDVPKNDLIGEDVRQTRKAKRLAWSAVVSLAMLLVAAIAAAVIAFQQRNVAEQRGEIAIARQLAAQSAIERSRLPALLPTSVTLAIESLKRYPSLEASETLRSAVDLLALPTGRAMLHERKVNGLAFAPDGSALATVSADGRMRLFEPATGDLQIDFPTGLDLKLVVFSTDGRYAAAAGYGSAWVWDVLNQNELARIEHGGSVAAMSFSPDSRSLAIAGWNHHTGDHFVQLWAPTGSRLPVAEMTHDATITALTFSHDGRYLATSSRDHIARLWDPATGVVLGTAQHDSEVEDLAFSPDGRYLATASRDATVRVWSVPAAIEVASLPHETVGSLMAVAFSPDSQLVASAHNNGVVRIWELARAREASRFEHGTQVNDVVFSPDGKWVASAGFDGTARIWDVVSQREIVRIVQAASVDTVAFSRSGRYIATAGANVARVWQYAGGSKSVRSVGPLEHSWGVALSPEGEYMAFSDLTGAELWSTREVRKVASFSDGKMGNALAVAADGKTVATGDRDGVRVWQPGQATSIHSLPLPYSVTALAISHDRSLVAIGGDNRFEVWELADPRRLVSKEYEANVNEVGFSFDDRHVSVATGDWTGSGEHAGTYLWRIEDGTEIHSFDHDARVGAARTSPDGRYLATGSGDAGVRVWRLDQPLNDPLRLDAEGPVVGLAFDPGSTRLAVSDQSGVVRVWELPDGVEVARMSFDEVIQRVALDSKDRLTTTSRNYRFGVWNLSADNLIREACKRLTRGLSDREWSRFLEEPPAVPTCESGPSATETAATTRSDSDP